MKNAASILGKIDIVSVDDPPYNRHEHNYDNDGEFSILIRFSAMAQNLVCPYIHRIGLNCVQMMEIHRGRTVTGHIQGETGPAIHPIHPAIYL